MGDAAEKHEGEAELAAAWRELADAIRSSVAAPHAEVAEFLTVEQAAVLLQLHESTIRAALDAGDAPWAKRIGRNIRISRSALLRWFDEGQEKPKRAKR
jgi:excisionase family DNA binding protein